MAEPSIREDRNALHAMLQPPGWPRPKGFANGIRARGETVFVGGMIGQDAQGRFAQGFVAQMKLALENIAAVLKEAGATPQHIVRLTWYVRDMDEYLGDLPRAGRRLSRGHGPALSRPWRWSRSPGWWSRWRGSRSRRRRCCRNDAEPHEWRTGPGFDNLMKTTAGKGRRLRPTDRASGHLRRKL